MLLPLPKALLPSSRPAMVPNSTLRQPTCSCRYPPMSTMSWLVSDDVNDEVAPFKLPVPGKRPWPVPIFSLSVWSIHSPPKVVVLLSDDEICAVPLSDADPV